MKSVNVKFNCLEISDHLITYELYSVCDFFRVKRNGGNPTITEMSLEESLKFLLSDIRNLRASRYFDSEPNIDGRVEDYLVKGEVELPDNYKSYVDRLGREIRTGKNNYIVYGRTGDQFLIDNVIYFDKLFLPDIDELNEKLKFES